MSILDIQSRSVKVAWSVEAASPAVDRLVVQWKEQAGKQSYFLTFEWYALVVLRYLGPLGMFLNFFVCLGKLNCKKFDNEKTILVRRMCFNICALRLFQGMYRSARWVKTYIPSNWKYLRFLHHDSAIWQRHTGPEWNSFWGKILKSVWSKLPEIKTLLSVLFSFLSLKMIGRTNLTILELSEKIRRLCKIYCNSLL